MHRKKIVKISVICEKIIIPPSPGQTENVGSPGFRGQSMRYSAPCLRVVN